MYYTPPQIVASYIKNLQAEWKTVSPDKLASKVISDLDLHCLKHKLSLWFVMVKVNLSPVSGVSRL